MLMRLIRNLSAISLILLLTACWTPLDYESGKSISTPNPLPTVRAPQVGQEWVYSKKDVFDSKELAVITERVSRIGPSIVLSRTDANGYQLPSEIQDPWGMISTDPHWSKLITYNPAIPLWPQNLSGGWSKQISTQYTVAGYPGNAYQWNLLMNSMGWESITVPAGTFNALKYENLIHFDSPDPSKSDCTRKETIWFVPQIGHWVAREATGSCILEGENNSLRGNTIQWQLQSYK